MYILDCLSDVLSATVPLINLQVDEFHASLQKAWRDSLSKKGTINRTRRVVDYFDKEFPTNLDHEDYPSWAFSSPGLGFSSSAAANPMQ
ncbi:hypothetical protein G6F37_014206 [Rhizopus arrhizus]|nr:hypothetical protein G6F37_014206 [Rhizopus arrhizus]